MVIKYSEPHEVYNRKEAENLAKKAIRNSAPSPQAKSVSGQTPSERKKEIDLHREMAHTTVKFHNANGHASQEARDNDMFHNEKKYPNLTSASVHEASDRLEFLKKNSPKYQEYLKEHEQSHWGSGKGNPSGDTK
jgi:hypothetical protein